MSTLKRLQAIDQPGCTARQVRDACRPSPPTEAQLYRWVSSGRISDTIALNSLFARITPIRGFYTRGPRRAFLRLQKPPSLRFQHETHSAGVAAIRA